VRNWHSPEEWRRATGLTPPQKPRVTVYALGGVADQPEAAYYSRRTSTIVFFNTSYYGDLKSWVLGAVGRVLAEESGIHSIRGACVVKDGRGVLYIAPVGAGKSTSAYGLVSASPDTRFHSDDWVYVRYTVATRDGHRLAPVEVTPAHGAPIRGARVFRWLEARRGVAGRVRGRDLADAEVTLPLAGLDLSAPVEAYAYTSEKVFYLRTSLARSFPQSACALLRSSLENVPDVTPAFLSVHAAELDALVEAVRRMPRDAAESSVRGMSGDELRVRLARLIAFDNGRAMLDLTTVLPADRVVTNPMEAVPLSTVILLKREPDDRTVLEALPLDRFLGRLLTGGTSARAREIAYNAYRAVDDDAERMVMARLEAEAVRHGGGADALYRAFVHAPAVPETLAQELELFRVLHQAARCYDLNTILASDPEVRDLGEAVARTIALIAYAVATRGTSVRVGLDDYRRVIAGSPASSGAEMGGDR